MSNLHEMSNPVSGKNKEIIPKCHLIKFLPSMLNFKYIWFAMLEKGPYAVCRQPRAWPACTFVQAGLGLCCLLTEWTDTATYVIFIYVNSEGKMTVWWVCACLHACMFVYVFLFLYEIKMKNKILPVDLSPSFACEYEASWAALTTIARPIVGIQP